jgi:hypothetical protein
VDDRYAILDTFTLIGTVQKPTLRSNYLKNHLLFTPLFLGTLPLERIKLIQKFVHFSDNSKKNAFQGPPKISIFNQSFSICITGFRIFAF